MGKSLDETGKGYDMSWSYDGFMQRVKRAQATQPKIVERVDEWSFAVSGDDDSITIIMYSDEKPMGVIDLETEVIGDGVKMKWVLLSTTNPNFPKAGLGTRMYLWALKKYGPIMSGMSQTTSAHALWAKLARTSGIEVVGWDMYKGKRVDVKPAENGFIVQSTGKEVHGDDDINLIMYWGKAPNKGLYEMETLNDMSWDYDRFVQAANTFNSKHTKIFDAGKGWSFGVYAWKGETHIIMYFENEPMGIMELKMDQIGDGQEVRWVSWSITNPKLPKRGLGTRMYLWALQKYGPIMSGWAQTEASHSLWVKLARTPGIEVVGWDTDNDKKVEVEPVGNEFVVKGTDTKVWGESGIYLIMYLGKANLHEIERLSISLGDHGFIDHVQDIIDLGDSEWFGDKGDGWEWRWRVVSDGTDTGIVMYGSEFGGMDEPVGIMRLIETKISDSKSFPSVNWSLINPKFRGVALGERMYLWALQKYGTIMSDKIQTDASHGLWKRLQKHSAIKMWGINTDNRNEFPIKLNGSEIVNANDNNPVFTDYPEAKKIRLVMSWGGKGLSEIRNIGDDLGGDDQEFKDDIKPIMNRNPEWVIDGEWRYAVVTMHGTVGIVMHLGEEPVGVIMLDPIKIENGPKLRIGWSHLNPAHRGKGGKFKGLGERMYLFALKHYGPLASDGLQTDSSHRLWARFGKNSAIKMWGLDLIDDGNDVYKGKKFAVKSTGTEVVNAKGGRPVVYGHESDTNVILVMDLKGANRVTISEINKIPVIGVSKSGFVAAMPQKIMNEPVVVFGGRRFRTVGNESRSTIVMYDEDDTPLGILNLAKYHGHMSIVLSVKNPETHERGVGEAMYLYALNKYGSLMSDRTQTQKSHDLWIRLGSKPGITVVGYDPGDGHDQSSIKKFPVKVVGDKFVNADSKKPIFIDSADDHSSVRLIMYANSSAAKLTEIWETGAFFPNDFNDDDVEPFEDEPFMKVTDKWRAKEIVDGGNVNIMIFDENEAPMARIDLIKYDGYKYVSWSAVTRKYRRMGVGEAMYIYALINHGPLMSDSVQSPQSHSLWARLAKMSNIEVRGYNEQTRKEFDVEVGEDEKTKKPIIVNASKEKGAPVVYAKNNIDPTRLVMRWRE